MQHPLSNKAVLTISQKINASNLVNEMMEKNITQKDACIAVVASLDLPITPNALACTLNRFNKSGGKIRNNMLFTAEQEDMFVAIITSFSLINRPLSRSDFIEHIKHLTSNPDHWNSSGWYHKFLNRHSDRIVESSCSTIEIKRASQSLRYTIEDFIKWMKESVVKKKINPDLIINADETRINDFMGKVKGKKLVHVSKKVNNVIKCPLDKAITYIPFVNHKKILFSVIILPNKKTFTLYSMEYFIETLDHPVYFGFTEKGWLNSECWFQIMQKFNKEMEEKFFGQPKFLVLDKLNIHMDLASMEYCIQNNISIGYFPKHSTHIIQPCDNNIFAALKKELKNAIGKKLTRITNNPRKIAKEMIPILLNAEKAITTNVIRSSWSNTGLIPFSEEKIRQNVDKNIGVLNEKNETNTYVECRNIVRSIFQEELNIVTDEINTNTPPSELIDIQKIFELKKQKTRKRSTSTATTNVSNDNKNPGADKSYKSKTKKQKRKYVCSSEDHKNVHDEDIDNTEEWECCSNCKSYQICPSCFAEAPEEFIDHEINCHP